MKRENKIMNDLLHDFTTHRTNWRMAIERARDTAEAPTPDADDAHYWQHELSAFDRAMAALDHLRSCSGVSDAKINEITMETLGQWPSFEAQSWACKVAHEVVKVTNVMIGQRGRWRVEEWKIWKGLDPINPRWGDLGFICSTYEDAVGLMDYEARAFPQRIRRVVFAPSEGV